MTAERSRKEFNKYRRHLNATPQEDEGCVFCAVHQNSPQMIQQTAHFKVIQNIFPYSVWDNQAVKDHLMIVPKLHTDTLADIAPRAAQEFVQLLGHYESKGYSVWARAPGSTMKSQVHQHTHLIRLEKRIIKGLLFIRKPYVRLVIK